MRYLSAKQVQGIHIEEVCPHNHHCFLPQAQHKAPTLEEGISYIMQCKTSKVCSINTIPVFLLKLICWQVQALSEGVDPLNAQL